MRVVQHGILNDDRRRHVIRIRINVVTRVVEERAGHPSGEADRSGREAPGPPGIGIPIRSAVMPMAVPVTVIPAVMNVLPMVRASSAAVRRVVGSEDNRAAVQVGDSRNRADCLGDRACRGDYGSVSKDDLPGRRRVGCHRSGFPGPGLPGRSPSWSRFLGTRFLWAWLSGSWLPGVWFSGRIAPAGFAAARISRHRDCRVQAFQIRAGQGLDLVFLVQVCRRAFQDLPPPGRPPLIG